MKKIKNHALILIYIIVLAGCGKTQEGLALSSEDISLSEDVLCSSDVLTFSDSLDYNNTLYPAEFAHAAYFSLLSGDISLFDDEQISKWGLENWPDYLQSENLIYEYAFLDLDGDGVDELLFQMENDPRGHNAVFHYANGRLFCWENDMVEVSSSHYPLSDGTMVSQYDYNNTCCYTIYRYIYNGEREELSYLFVRESLIEKDSDEPCPYYEINGTQVDQIVFEEQIKELIMNRILPRAAWTTL